MVRVNCEDRRSQGRVPTMLGLPGILALMYDKISRYNSSMLNDEVIDLASDAMFAVELITKNLPEYQEETTEDTKFDFGSAQEEALKRIFSSKAANVNKEEEEIELENQNEEEIEEAGLTREQIDSKIKQPPIVMGTGKDVLFEDL